MSSEARVQQLAFEAAERRVLENLRGSAGSSSSTRRATVLITAAVLFGCTFAARLAIHDPDALVANFYAIPVAVLAIEFGPRAGALGAALGVALTFAWGVINTVHVGALGYTARGVALLLTGVVVGHLSTRLRLDIVERRRAERDLALYADQLERANQELARGVERLEAFAEIVRTVGGETDLQRVLALIQSHGQEIASARRLVVFLPEGDELVAATRESLPSGLNLRLPVRDSLAGQVLLTGRSTRLTRAEQPEELARLMPDASSAILVPLVFRGGILGVLVGLDRIDDHPFGQEDEQLLESVAASAATAVATARSIAAERLRLSLDAAEQARARWARELHDQTLQGLTGARMMLSAGLAREDLDALRRAAEAADAHLAAETRSLRDLISELRPAALDDLGLGPAVESLAKRQAAAGGFEIQTEIALAEDGRPRELESAIYRIIQEALSNVVRHAHASHVKLELRQHSDRVRIFVRDDGAGFALGAAGEGFGLTGMRERALLLGGELSVRSAQGGPTSVTAELPLFH